MKKAFAHIKIPSGKDTIEIIINTIAKWTFIKFNKQEDEKLEVKMIKKEKLKLFKIPKYIA
jgi:hypothetical protein